MIMICVVEAEAPADEFLTRAPSEFTFDDHECLPPEDNADDENSDVDDFSDS